MAQYRAIADIYLPGDRYVQAATVFSDTGPGALIPMGWQPPTGSVDPIDTPAITAYWSVGPRGQSDAQPSQWSFPFGFSHWSNIAYSPPSIYWVRVPGGFQLTGAGASLGVHPPVP